MAPESPSPSASAVLLPLIGASKSRRGSLASITSRKEIDKDALQQVLDNIHTSASKSDTLTSFHDFDGGAGAARAGTKELVSSGMSGLYNRLRQSVGGTTPTKDGKGRPGSSASSYSKRSSSLHSASPAPSKTGFGKSVAPDGASTGVAPGSPLPSGFMSSADKYDMQIAGSKSDLLETASVSTDPQSLRDTSGVSTKDQTASHQVSVDLSSQADIDRARGALRDEDYSESATGALARVLSNRDVHINDRARSPQNLRIDDDMDHAIVDDNGDENMPPIEPSISSSTVATSHRAKSIGTLDSSNDSRRPERRPPMVRVGVSHLPGFDASTPGSPVPRQPASSGSSQVDMRAHGLDPSPNLSSGLQRKRTGLKPQPAHTPVVHSVPSHFRRRVISKEFWMKDENAKDCFNCGQSFSTFRRKHHCRTCGQIFDARCTSLVSARPFGQPGTLRLCKPCEEIILGSNDDDSSVYSEDGAESLRTPHARRPTPEHVHFSGTIDEVSSSLPSAGEVMTPFIGIPASRRNREAKRRSAVIEFDAGHTLARPSSSRSLVSLSARPRSSSHKRHQSRQSFLRGRDDRAPFHQESSAEPETKHALPAFHNDNIIDPDLAPYLSDDGSEYEEPHSIFSTISPEGPMSSPGDRERLGVGSLLASAMKKGRSKLGDRATVASSVKGVKEDDVTANTSRHVPRLSRKRNPSINSINMGRPSPRRSRSNVLLTTIETEDLDQRPSTPFVFPRPAGSQLVRSSAMRGSEAPPVELNRASLDHVRKLLQQLLTDAAVENASAWEKALIPVLLQCTNDVEPDVQRGDDMDIRHYIKLKKIPGGRPGDTSYVSGIVFSKNVALKSMARSIRQPRIAIVTFAIEYARHQSHFMSLEPVIAQEREYLRNLVGRIATLQPHVLLVQRNVSGVALRLLEEAGITVAFNIKESVLAAVARVTQTTMIKSVDKLAIDPSHLGQCSSFDVKTYVHQGHRKTYIVLSGCMPDLGCTIVLRGSDTKVLRTIKRITEFMCYVVYSLKLETNLMRDEFVSMPAARPDPMKAHDRPIRNGLDPLFVDVEGEAPSKYGRVEDETRRRILSASPFVIFMQPHMLTQLCDQEQKLATFKRLRDQYAAADVEGDSGEEATANERFELVRPEMVHAPASKDQPKAVREYLHAVHSAQFERAMASYDSQRKLWESFVATNVDPFDPYSHQSIVVLHSTVSSITSAPCVGPEVLGIGFYAGYNHVEPQFEEDCTLGQFVEDICLSAGSTCKECTRRMYDHHRQYVHGYGQMSISVQRQPTRVRGLSNTILMWASCRLCHAETTVIPMSDNTWKYSFAKYLELTFWSSPLHPRAGVCEHDIHKDFLRCFGFQDLVVRVQYDPVEIYDIVVPKPIITWKVEADLTVKNEQYSHIVGRLTAFIDSVKKRLTSINVDTLDEKQMIEAQDMIESLRQRAEDDRTELLTKLQTKYGSSRYYEIIPLNRAFRFMDEKALAWDEAFNNFERDYFPSETDIRKLAAAQLKEMFYGAHSTAESVSTDASDTEGAAEAPPTLHKSIGQRIAEEDYSSEKANNVLTTVAQEHRASRDENSHEIVGAQDIPATICSNLTKTISPLEDQEIAAEREEVKHLDLAIAARSPEDNRLVEEPLESSEVTGKNEQPTATAGSSDEPFAVQPKPLSSGLLERIEQIRNNRAAGIEDGELPESRIPRLAAKNRGQSPQPTPPPLHRSQTQPNHVPRHSADLKLEGVESVSGSYAQVTEPPAHDRLRMSDRLTQLSNKIGKLPPSLIPRSIPAKAENGLPSSVSALAKHFEQMSREFEKERLRERRQRAAKSRQARANPLGSSQPVVEIYRNATDAVGERTPEHLGAGSGASPRPEPITRVDHAIDKSFTESEGLALQDQVQISVDSDVPVQQAEQQTGSDAETDGEATDTEIAPQKTRPRDMSDPLSHISSTTHISPSSNDLELHPEFSIAEHKKNVWFKMLADFWSKRSASGWSNLEYPLHSTEHVFEDSDIIVREDEPSSVVAISLSSSDYLKKLEEFRNNPKMNPRTRHRHTTSMASASFTEEADLNNIVEASLLSDTGTHMKYSFAHGSVKASCKIFYAESFDALRRRCGVADRFVESMSRCLKFDSKGGKTKSIFLKTLDNRFIIKSLQEVELKAFTKFAPDYFNFMSHTLFHGVPSVIAKMFGLFQVIIKNPVTGMDFSYYLLVMENLFYEHNPNRRFDLKGSMRNRKIEPTGQSDEVLLDENLVETIFESPLFVREHHRKLLQASVWNDTLWLCKQNVMDYSLMAGFDDDAKQLVVGIIDCIRTYTWDKKLESWIKDRGKNKPTITSPKDYRNRFRVSMMQYVLQAPNCWHQFQAQMAPPKTLREREDYYAAEGMEAEEGGKRSEG
jgi:1-phosphatidylinositol-3-phosphate 5-kinase